jgi:2-polyprenyl-3-methyl-5-hydroxy-6-metoxy-1,4-benzoquinol methylase
MGVTVDQARDFFNLPTYLQRGRFLIDARTILVRELLAGIRPRHILDLGCGDGSISIPLLEAADDLTLVDLSPRMLELAASRIPEQLRSRTRLVNATLGEFAPTRRFDLVLCIGVLAHVPDIDAAAEKIALCLGDGGSAVVEFTPNPNPLASLLFPYYWLRGRHRGSLQGYETNRMPLAQLLQIFACHSLQLARLRRHFFPLPTMAWWPQRWLYRYAVRAMRSKLVSRIGTEHIMLLSKKAANSDS